jgi:hypothetical protein
MIFLLLMLEIETRLYNYIFKWKITDVLWQRRKKRRLITSQECMHYKL